LALPLRRDETIGKSVFCFFPIGPATSHGTCPCGQTCRTGKAAANATERMPPHPRYSPGEPFGLRLRNFGRRRRMKLSAERITLVREISLSISASVLPSRSDKTSAAAKAISAGGTSVKRWARLI